MRSCSCASSRRAGRSGRRSRSSRSAAAATSGPSGSSGSRMAPSKSGKRCARSAAYSPGCRSTKGRTRLSSKIMSTEDQARLDRRLLMLPATPKDGATARDVLWRAGIETELCESVRVVASEVQRGAAAVMLPEEAIGVASQLLALGIAQQAPWSDLPVLVLTRQGADSADATLAVSALGNVTLLER